MARKVGCDKSTVSRALRRLSGVNPETAARIMKAATDLGYRPDPVQSVAASHRWRPGSKASIYLIAFLQPNFPETEQFRISANLNLFTAAKVRLLTYGSRLEIFGLTTYPKPESLSRVLRARGYRGIIVPPFPPNAADYLRSIRWEDFTTVALKTGWALPPAHIVDTDAWAGVHLAWSKLRALGYTRIGCAPASHDPMAEDDFIRHGAFYSLHEKPKAAVKRLRIYKGTTRDRKSFLKWVREVKPDAIIGMHNLMHYWLIEAGIRVPDDIAFVSLHVNEQRQITGILANPQGVAHAASDLLMTHIRNNHWGIPMEFQRILIKPHWNAGTTVREKPPLPAEAPPEKSPGSVV